jgi:hypothetical protein
MARASAPPLRCYVKTEEGAWDLPTSVLMAAGVLQVLVFVGTNVATHVSFA